MRVLILYFALSCGASALAHDASSTHASAAAAARHSSADGVTTPANELNEQLVLGGFPSATALPSSIPIAGPTPPLPAKQQRQKPSIPDSGREHDAGDGRSNDPAARTFMQLPWLDKLADEPIPEEERLTSPTVRSSFSFSHTSQHQGPNGEETHHTRLDYDIEHHAHIFRLGDESSLPGRKFAFCGLTDLVMLFVDVEDQRKASALLEREDPAMEKNVLFVETADGLHCDAQILELTPMDPAKTQQLVESSLEIMHRARQHAFEVHASRPTTSTTQHNTSESTARNATFTFPVFTSGLAFATRQLSLRHLIKNGYMDFFTNHTDHEYAQLPISATWLHIHAQASTQIAAENKQRRKQDGAENPRPHDPDNHSVNVDVERRSLFDAAISLYNKVTSIVSTVTSVTLAVVQYVTTGSLTGNWVHGYSYSELFDSDSYRVTLGASATGSLSWQFTNYAPVRLNATAQLACNIGLLLRRAGSVSVSQQYGPYNLLDEYQIGQPKVFLLGAIPVIMRALLTLDVSFYVEAALNYRITNLGADPFYSFSGFAQASLMYMSTQSPSWYTTSVQNFASDNNIRELSGSNMQVTGFGLTIQMTVTPKLLIEFQAMGGPAATVPLTGQVFIQWPPSCSGPGITPLVDIAANLILQIDLSAEFSMTLQKKVSSWFDDDITPINIFNKKLSQTIFQRLYPLVAACLALNSGGLPSLYQATDFVYGSVYSSPGFYTSDYNIYQFQVLDPFQRQFLLFGWAPLTTGVFALVYRLGSNQFIYSQIHPSHTNTQFGIPQSLSITFSTANLIKAFACTNCNSLFQQFTLTTFDFTAMPCEGIQLASAPAVASLAGIYGRISSNFNGKVAYRSLSLSVPIFIGYMSGEWNFMSSITATPSLFMSSAKSSENAVQLVGGWFSRSGGTLSPLSATLSCVKFINPGGACGAVSVGVVQMRCANLTACKNGFCCNAAASSDSNCIQCGSDGQCSGCALGYSLMTGNCQAICDGLALEGLPSQLSFLGVKPYARIADWSSKPAYKMLGSENYFIYFLPAFDAYVVSASLGADRAYTYQLSSAAAPQSLVRGQFYIYTGTSWQLSPSIALSCVQILSDGAPCSATTFCSSTNCKSTCCGPKGQASTCTACDRNGDCATCTAGFLVQSGRCICEGLFASGSPSRPLSVYYSALVGGFNGFPAYQSIYSSVTTLSFLYYSVSQQQWCISAALGSSNCTFSSSSPSSRPDAQFTGFNSSLRETIQIALTCIDYLPAGSACSAVSNTTVCSSLSCKAGFCCSAPDSRCQRCGSNGQCSLCVDGFVPQGGVCVPLQYCNLLSLSGFGNSSAAAAQGFYTRISDIGGRAAYQHYSSPLRIFLVAPSSSWVVAHPWINYLSLSGAVAFAASSPGVFAPQLIPVGAWLTREAHTFASLPNSTVACASLLPVAASCSPNSSTSMCANGPDSCKGGSCCDIRATADPNCLSCDAFSGSCSSCRTGFDLNHNSPGVCTRCLGGSFVLSLDRTSGRWFCAKSVMKNADCLLNFTGGNLTLYTMVTDTQPLQPGATLPASLPPLRQEFNIPTFDDNPVLKIESSGNIVIVNSRNVTVWSSGTAGILYADSHDGFLSLTRNTARQCRLVWSVNLPDQLPFDFLDAWIFPPVTSNVFLNFPLFETEERRASLLGPRSLRLVFEGSSFTAGSAPSDVRLPQFALAFYITPGPEGLLSAQDLLMSTNGVLSSAPLSSNGTRLRLSVASGPSVRMIRLFAGHETRFRYRIRFEGVLNASGSSSTIPNVVFEITFFSGNQIMVVTGPMEQLSTTTTTTTTAAAAAATSSAGITTSLLVWKGAANPDNGEEWVPSVAFTANSSYMLRTSNFGSSWSWSTGSIINMLDSSRFTCLGRSSSIDLGMVSALALTMRESFPAGVYNLTSVQVRLFSTLPEVLNSTILTVTALWVLTSEHYPGSFVYYMDCHYNCSQFGADPSSTSVLVLFDLKLSLVSPWSCSNISTGFTRTTPPSTTASTSARMTSPASTVPILPSSTPATNRTSTSAPSSTVTRPTSSAASSTVATQAASDASSAATSASTASTIMTSAFSTIRPNTAATTQSTTLTTATITPTPVSATAASTAQIVTSSRASITTISTNTGEALLATTVAGASTATISTAATPASRAAVTSASASVAPAVSSAVPSSSTTTTTAATTTQDTGVVGSAGGSEASSSSSSSSLPIIVGAVVGGAALLALVAALIVHKYHRKGSRATVPAAHALASPTAQLPAPAPSAARLGPSRMGWMQSPDLLRTTSVSTSNPVYGQFVGTGDYDDPENFTHTAEYDAAVNPWHADYAESTMGSGTVTLGPNISPLMQTSA